MGSIEAVRATSFYPSIPVIQPHRVGPPETAHHAPDHQKESEFEDKNNSDHNDDKIAKNSLEDRNQSLKDPNFDSFETQHIDFVA